MGQSKQSTGNVEVDLGRYELRRSGRRMKIEKKPMELLIFLLERREQMVSREEIVKRLWRSDLFIDTEKNVNNIVRKLRTALGDDADKPRFIETVIGKGYRFIGPVGVIGAQYPRVGLDETESIRGDRELTGGAGDDVGARISEVGDRLLYALGYSCYVRGGLIRAHRLEDRVDELE